MQFPQYRKYKNMETYFKIISEKEFEEIKVVGKKYILHTVKAEQYPERLRIQDMLENEEELWDVITEEEFLERELYILSNFQNIHG